MTMDEQEDLPKDMLEQVQRQTQRKKHTHTSSEDTKDTLHDHYQFEYRTVRNTVTKQEGEHLPSRVPEGKAQLIFPVDDVRSVVRSDLLHHTIY